ncbi:MAG: nucleotidyltransferase family protein [Bacteroidales bacterium]|jgi:dTDP-glucose pyrophosphorylase|nr:nucleotidyltransferase family protein [Bacteroidales bacterium]
MKNYSYKEHLIFNDTPIKNALERFNKLGRDAIAFVVNKNNKLIGSLTDGDVRRGLLKGYTIDNFVEEIIQPHPRFFRKGEHNINKVIEYRDNNFQIIPVLNKDDEVVNIINFGYLKSYLPVDAVIMAGGRGIRLKPLTDDTPKPLLKVGDKPILEHNINRLRLYGIDDFWITVKYLGNQIEEYFGDGRERNITIQYIYEDDPMGTIGSVSKINNFNHDYVLVTNSDLLTNIDYEHFFLDFIKQEADFSVVTIPYSVDVPYAVLETNNGHILNFREKPTYTYYSNGGIYLMRKELLKLIPIEKHYNATDLMEALIKSGKKVISYPLAGYWLDIGKHEDYEKAQRDILNISFK